MVLQIFHIFKNSKLFPRTGDKSGKMKKASKAEQIKLKPPSVFQLGFCDPGREEAIQQNCLVDLPRPGRLCLHQPAFSRVVSLTTTPPSHPPLPAFKSFEGKFKMGVV